MDTLAFLDEFFSLVSRKQLITLKQVLASSQYLLDRML